MRSPIFGNFFKNLIVAVEMISGIFFLGQMLADELIDAIFGFNCALKEVLHAVKIKVGDNPRTHVSDCRSCFEVKLKLNTALQMHN